MPTMESDRGWQDHVPQPLAKGGFIGLKSRRGGAAGRQPVEAHGKHGDQQQRHPEAGAGGEHHRKAPDDPVRPAPARGRRHRAKAKTEHEGKGKGRRNQRQRGGKPVADDLEHGRVVGDGIAEVAGERVARPAQKPLAEWIVQTPGRGNRLALLRPHLHHLRTDKALHRINGRQRDQRKQAKGPYGHHPC